MIEMGATDAEKILGGVGAAHVVLEAAGKSVADVSEGFFHALDVRGRQEFPTGF